MRRSRALLQSLLFCTACAASGVPVESRNAETSGASATEEHPSLPAIHDPSDDEDSSAAPPSTAAPSTAAPSEAAPTLDVPAETVPVQTRVAVSPQVLVLIAQMEEDLDAINMVRPFLMRIRTETALPSEGAPEACRSDLRARVADMIRQGLAPAGSNLSSLRDAIDNLCARFERWETPNEIQRNRIARYRALLDRIDEWMTDIRRCVSPGPYDFRCENAYGAQTSDSAAQAEAAMAVVREVRGVLVGVPEAHPFPCYSSVWRRVEATTWTMNVARAQIPRVARFAFSLCESLGVDADSLNTQIRLIHDRLERSNASLIQQSESRQDILNRMVCALGTDGDTQTRCQGIHLR